MHGCVYRYPEVFLKKLIFVCRHRYYRKTLNFIMT